MQLSENRYRRPTATARNGLRLQLCIFLIVAFFNQEGTILYKQHNARMIAQSRHY
jgi:hypothetical protein